MSSATPERGERERVAEWGDGSAMIDTLEEETPVSLVAESWNV